MVRRWSWEWRWNWWIWCLKQVCCSSDVTFPCSICWPVWPVCLALLATCSSLLPNFLFRIWTWRFLCPYLGFLCGISLLFLSLMPPWLTTFAWGCWFLQVVFSCSSFTSSLCSFLPFRGHQPASWWYCSDRQCDVRSWSCWQHVKPFQFSIFLWGPWWWHLFLLWLIQARVLSCWWCR